MDALAIRRLIAQGRYSYSRHAERERQADIIFTHEIDEALRIAKLSRTIPMIREGQAV